jgi:bifunctional non-homologous end joining protein LigD
VALDDQGRQDFRLLMAGRGNLHYAVFDVLWLKGKDLRECPLSRRKRILRRLVKKTSTVLSPIFGVRGHGRDLFAAVERLDLEGVVAKRLADPYTPDTVWRKIRNGAYTQMEGRRELFHPGLSRRS